MKRTWMLFLVLVLFAVRIVSAVVMDPSVDYMASDWTLNSRSSINVDYINMSSSWINLGNYGNITFADNVSSTRDLIELFGNYALGNYTTELSVDVYAPSDWTAVVSLTPVTNNSENDTTLSLSTFTQVNSTHRQYSGTYNPSNDLSAADMGYFDVNVSVTAYNATLQYSGYNVSEDVFEVYMLNPVTEINSSYNSTFHSVNFSWGATEEAVYYFDNYNAGEAWAGTPANMVDGDISTRASCTSDPDIQLCTSNTCSGANIGNVTQVYVRVLAQMWSSKSNQQITLRPVLNGTTDMDNHVYTMPSTWDKTWSSWYDITNDTNAPADWNFTLVDNLDIDVEGTSPGGGGIYCYRVELKVIYDTALANSSTDRFVLVRNNNSYPTDPTDGYEVQNSTSTTYDVPLDFTQAYFMIFAYNATTHSYSEGTEMPWGCIGISVFNESAPHQNIGFEIEITDGYGTETYYATDMVSTLYINVEDIPYGEDTIFTISNSTYKQRVYYYDLAVNNFYNYSFYLPPAELPGGGGSSGEGNITHQYRIRVIDDYGYPVANAKATIKRYINTTDEYTTVSIIITNGYGEADAWLIPEEHYKVWIDADGYAQEHPIPDWFPDPLFYGANYPRTFQIYTVVAEIENYSFWEDCVFNATIDTTGILTVNYIDSLTNTTDAQFYTYEVFNDTETLVATNTTIADAYTFYVTGLNHSRTHRVVIHLNHTNFGYMVQTILIRPARTPEYNRDNINTMVTNIIGNFDLPWIELLFVYIPCLFFLLVFGKKHTEIGIVGSGLWITFVSALILLNPVTIGSGVFLIFFGGIYATVKHGGKNI